MNKPQFKAIGQLLLLTLRDFTREPAVIFWTLGFPILMTLTMGQMTQSGGDLKASVAVVYAPGEEPQARAWAGQAPLQNKIQ
jgi:hypothetical protein